MEDIDRRSTFALGLAAASAFVFTGPSIAEAAVGDETELAKGVKIKTLGEGPAMIPGYKTVRLQDITFQPGSTLPASEMKNPMVCHVTEGELQVTQDGGKPFAAKKNSVWSCNTGTKEGSTNSGSAVAVMRILNLLTA
jgi:quercetin dioxygenase-like cupin family protein